MKRLTELFVLAVLGMVVITTARPLSLFASNAAQETKRPNPGKTEGTSLTGCVDEQDGEYILTDDTVLQPIARLQADGFPQEGFAKHVGHKVTVKGQMSQGGAPPVMKVRSVTAVSDSCTPTREGG